MKPALRAVAKVYAISIRGYYLAGEQNQLEPWCATSRESSTSLLHSFTYLEFYSLYCQRSSTQIWFIAVLNFALRPVLKLLLFELILVAFISIWAVFYNNQRLVLCVSGWPMPKYICHLRLIPPPSCIFLLWGFINDIPKVFFIFFACLTAFVSNLPPVTIIRSYPDMIYLHFVGERPLNVKEPPRVLIRGYWTEKLRNR